jgi:hypothetical protein
MTDLATLAGGLLSVVLVGGAVLAFFLYATVIIMDVMENGV